MDSGSVELYGYIAARDILEPLLNYVVKFCRDEPIIVQQGSLIEMTGPKRGIELFFHGSRNMASRSGVKGELVKPARGLIPSANDVLIPLGTKEFLARYGDDHREDKRRASVNVISGEEDSCRTTMEIIDSKLDTSGETVDVTGTQEDRTRATKYHRGATVVSDDELYPSWAADPIDGVCPIPILPNSSHGDGSIYRGIDIWKQHYHIADRNETRLEAKMFSDPTDYDARYGTGIISTTRNMLQIISLKLAKLPVGYNSVELYGYIALRERMDPLLNYVVKFCRDDLMIVEQHPFGVIAAKNASM
ncbi:hypothetical protein QOZ80_2AG0101790 [Eleusine coracana subsp. coracana]|nr:hypothetical protein QOZ80_2AG0101790 [Eleusine coracana subsp. coracana]